MAAPFRRLFMKKGYLILENGRVFEGVRFGAMKDAVGELVFTTGMCGYIETLTDPSYCGQIIMQTFPLIGNYGIIESDFEGDCAALGYIVREACDHPSNFRSEYDLDTFLRQRGVPGLMGVETREITRILRDAGTMNAMISDSVPEDLGIIRSYAIKGAVDRVSGKTAHTIQARGREKCRVALIDYGTKGNIPEELAQRGCRVDVLPCDVQAGAILSAGYDGVMLSNGPGDPAENVYQISVIKELVGNIPIFGICLGHQLLALAMGARTMKLHFGHRGANQPVKDLATGRTYITSQNHGYAVDSGSIEGIGRVRFVNANDGTCEGVDYPDAMAFTAQFHPEACSGPEDTHFLFDRFVAMMEDR